MAFFISFKYNATELFVVHKTNAGEKRKALQREARADLWRE